QLAVRHAGIARGRADALNPQRTELPLALAAVAVGIAFRAIHRFLGGLIELRLSEEKSFCAPQIFFAARAALGSAFDSSHVVFSYAETQCLPKHRGRSRAREPAHDQKARASPRRV